MFRIVAAGWRVDPEAPVDKRAVVVAQLGRAAIGTGGEQGENVGRVEDESDGLQLAGQVAGPLGVKSVRRPWVSGRS